MQNIEQCVLSNLTEIPRVIWSYQAPQPTDSPQAQPFTRRYHVLAHRGGVPCSKVAIRDDHKVNCRGQDRICQPCVFSEFGAFMAAAMLNAPRVVVT
jgi:hypothetical protein